MGSFLRFSHAGTNEVLALPALNPDFLYAALNATAYAAFVKESRKKRAGATKLHRKSGEARNAWVVRQISPFLTSLAPWTGAPCSRFRVRGLNTTFFQCFHHRSTPTYRKRRRK